MIDVTKRPGTSLILSVSYDTVTTVVKCGPLPNVNRFKADDRTAVIVKNPRTIGYCTRAGNATWVGMRHVCLIAKEILRRSIVLKLDQINCIRKSIARGQVIIHHHQIFARQ